MEAFTQLTLNSSFSSSSLELTKEIVFISEENFSNNIIEAKLRILHFNDVYDIEGNIKEQTGGASRFQTALKYLREDEPCLVLFSGDAFSPSTCK